MRFEKEADRLEHPQAHLIPRQVWASYFPTNEITESEITLMTIPIDSISARLGLAPNLNQQEKERVWLAIVYSHPAAEPAKLIEFANQLGIETNTFFILAIETGNIEILNLLISGRTPDKLQEMIAADGYCAFQRAATNGHLIVLDRLFEKCAANKIQEMIASAGYCAFQ